MMKSRNYLLILLSLTLTGMPALAVPFVPDDARALAGGWYEWLELDNIVEVLSFCEER